MRKIECVARDRTIAYPKSKSEFEVQSEVFSLLAKKGIHARGEVSFYGSFGLRESKASCRFDIVCFDDSKKAFAIVEIKAKSVKHKKTLEDTRQYKKYTTFGVPVFYVNGEDDIEEAVNAICKIVN